MSQATMSIRVDQTLKRKFDSLCEAFGLSATAALNIFMKAVVRERRIPFEIRADEKDMAIVNAMQAFEMLRQSTAGMSEMSLDDINSEIKAVRDERKNLRRN